MSIPPVKLLDQVRSLIRMKHYSIRTEEAYASWIKRFILFHGKRHPKDLSAKDIEAFLSYLAVTRKVAASTQNQAFNAILFLYDKVLHLETFEKIDAVCAKVPKRLPVVLSQDGVFSVIDAISGVHQLVIKIIYGAGLRGIECLRLRVKDVDFERNQIDVRRGKGQKDRITMLPMDLHIPQTQAPYSPEFCQSCCSESRAHCAHCKTDKHSCIPPSIALPPTYETFEKQPISREL